MKEATFLFQKVKYLNMICIVTNAHACGGRKVQVSPVGNGDSPAKYFDADPLEIKSI